MSISRLRFFDICTKIRQITPAQPCLLCGVYSRDGSWCKACDASLPYMHRELCPICALPTPAGSVCGQCLQHPPGFNHTVAVFAYGFPLDKLVLAFKYGTAQHLGDQLADTLLPRIHTRPDCIVPMPLHPLRLRERGFNQSMQLARRVGRKLDLPVLATACQRLRYTASQSSLPWKERNKNIRKAFACAKEVEGKHVAIVDDVMTTGATLNSLATTLKEAGASEVTAWIIARALPHSGSPNTV